MGINWKHRKVIVSIVMCVLLCVTAITAMMYTAFGAGSSNIKNVNAIQVYSNDKAGSADTSEGTDTTGNMDKAGPTATRPTAVRLTAAITTRRTTTVSSRTQKQQNRFGMQKALMKA